MMDHVLAMTWVDLSALVILGVSVLIGIFRGVIREITALASWVIAFWLANQYAVWLSGKLASTVENDTMRLILAFGVIVLVTLIVLTVLGIWLGRLLDKVGFTLLNHTLGGVFGLLRGALIVVMLTLLAGLTALPEQKDWNKSLLTPWMTRGALWVLPHLPEEFAKRINLKIPKEPKKL